MCYGSYTNLELLEQYGFILDDNPYEVCPVPLPMLDLSTVGSCEQHECYVCFDGSPSWQALKHLRLSSVHSQVGSKFRHLAVSGNKIDDASEKKALERWRRGCRMILRSLSSVEDDVTKLQATKMEDEKLHCAIRWRIIQKEMLQKGAIFCKDLY